MKLIKRVAGEYTDRNGNKKPNWATVGQLIEKDGKQYVKIFASLAYEEQFCSVFDTEQTQRQTPATPQNLPDVDLNEEIEL